MDILSVDLHPAVYAALLPIIGVVLLALARREDRERERAQRASEARLAEAKAQEEAEMRQRLARRQTRE